MPLAAPTTETFSCETERLCLRPLAAGDEALFHALYTDQETMRHIGPVLSVGQAADAFRSILARMQRRPPGCVYLAMLDRTSQQSLGICGVPRFDASAFGLEVGLVLAGPARSRGIAREGLAALVDRIFNASFVDEIRVQFSGENLAAQRLVVAVGFKACDEVPSKQELSSERHWSVQRSCWRGVKPYQQQGVNNVECDRFS